MGEICTNGLTGAFNFNDMVLGHCNADTSPERSRLLVSLVQALRHTHKSLCDREANATDSPDDFLRRSCRPQVPGTLEFGCGQVRDLCGRLWKRFPGWSSVDS